jgi:hypothetical protein
VQGAALSDCDYSVSSTVAAALLSYHSGRVHVTGLSSAELLCCSCRYRLMQAAVHVALCCSNKNADPSGNKLSRMQSQVDTHLVSLTVAWRLSWNASRFTSASLSCWPQHRHTHLQSLPVLHCSGGPLDSSAAECFHLQRYLSHARALTNTTAQHTLLRCSDSD